MGLDNGICIKRKTASKDALLQFDEEWRSRNDYDLEVAYWRKCWNVRDIILCALNVWQDNDSQTTMTVEDVENIIKSYIVEQKAPKETPKRRVYAGAGDYFSQEDYDQVRHADDNVFSRYARKSKVDTKPAGEVAEPTFDIFTETLAQIYAEQGYYEQAKDVYSKLILAYPEKNAYFAALIQKIDELN